MTEPTLFGDDAHLPPPPAAAAPSTPAGTPRLRPVVRNQVEMRCASLDQLLPPDHEARLLWDYVEGLDLTPLLAGIKAVAGRPGRDANDPRVLFGLWLFATFKGIGSARELDRLCREHLAYQWLCGGMSVNYHDLADFRAGHADVLDQYLTDNVAALLHEGLVELECVAQDGLKVRASAGAASFRREPSLQECLETARRQVQALHSQADEDDGAASRRQQAARKRAAEDRVGRVQKALQERQKLVALREQHRQDKGVAFDPAAARASTTDPEARRMKMADGGTRPAFNVQFATTPQSGIIVGVDVTNSGGDGGQLAPMIEQIHERYGQTPSTALVDGGFATLKDIEDVHQDRDVDVYAPIKDEEKKKAAGTDPYEPRPKDGPGVAAWRRRMGTAEGQALYRLRAQTAEWANAGARNRGLYQVRVRGRQKVLAVALLHALVHNVLRAQALRQAKAAAAEGR